MVYKAANYAGITISDFISDASSCALSLFKESEDDRIVLFVIVKEGYLDIGIFEYGNGVIESLTESSFKLSFYKDEIDYLISKAFDDASRAQTRSWKEAAAITRTMLGEIVVSGEGDYVTDVMNNLQQIIPGKRIRLMPEESIAIGASVRAGQLTGVDVISNALLLYSIPYEVSINTGGETETTIIEKDICALTN